ncbi:MAG: DivIVA domain-containing protein [Cyclobacteriaceae bacterium]
MKITPLEIRQKDFEKKLRGYDKDEVTAFLLSLSNEWERVLDENKELTLKLKHAEKEVSKLREVESSLYKTLKTAEDTGANLIDQSNKAADLHMKETQMRAEGLMNEAKSKAKAMMEKAEVEARQIIEELQEAVKSIEQNHRDIENHRRNAIGELKNLSVDLIEKVERTTKEQKEFRFDDYVKRVKELARESGERIKSEETELVMPETPKIEESVGAKDQQAEEKEPTQPKEVVEKKIEAPAEPQKEEPITRTSFDEAGEDPELEEVPENGAVGFVASDHEEEPAAAEEPIAKETESEEKLEPKVEEPETDVAEDPEIEEEPEPVIAEEPEAEIEKEPEPVIDEKPQPEEDPELIKAEEPEEEIEEEPEPVVAEVPEEPEPVVTEEPEAIVEEPVTDAKEEQEEEPEPEEKPGPRIARTVSFFDEIDDED